MKINLNQSAKVKLTKKGQLVLKTHSDILYRMSVDAGGYCTLQLWELMEVFGPHIYHGCEPLMDMNVEVLPLP